MTREKRVVHRKHKKAETCGDHRAMVTKALLGEERESLE